MPKKFKFKVGDLIKVHGVSIFPFFTGIEDGTCGVIVERVDQDDTFNKDQTPSFFFFDYIVLVGNNEYYMFEEEIKRYSDEYCEGCECDPCDCHWGIE